MKNRSFFNSPRLLELKKKKWRIFRKKILFLIFLFILILTGLLFFSKWGKINIDNIQITGNRVIETDQIQKIVEKKIVGYYFWFLPKTNFLFYPKTGIKKELTAGFKKLKNISLNVKNFKTLEVFLTERTALYTYCGVMPIGLNNLAVGLPNGSPTAEKCYFMDADGYIFDEAPYFSGEVYLKFYGKTDLGHDDPSGSYFFRPNFKKLILFKETLEKMGIKGVAFFMEDSEDIKMFLSSKVKGELGPEIIFKADSDFGKMLENLQSVLTTEPLQSDFKNKYSSLLYIDLRFGNKIYYKFH